MWVVGSAGGHSVVSQAPLHQLVTVSSAAAGGTEEENIPARSKGKRCASCMMGLEQRGRGVWGGVEDIWRSCDHVPVFHSSPPILPSSPLLVGKISRGELKGLGIVSILFLPSDLPAASITC